MERVCMYLRKSRADEEAEKRGEGETLTKHKTALLKVVKSKNLNIVKIREEVVSGESLIHRPQMLELLKEVEEGKYDAVLCMDIDRLGRGNMQEQGLILETLKNSNTKVITPRKTYDLHDEFDEEYSEFEAFMARKELKIINRRLQRGRIMSIEKGNYIATLPPYGYEIEYRENGIRTLKPHPEQSKVVELIFDWYVDDGLGGNNIATKLNKLGYRSYTGKDLSSSAVLTMIKNPVYIGKVCWRKKKFEKSKDPSKKRIAKLQNVNDWIIVDGKHPPLVSEEMFYKAQDILNKKYHVPYQIVNGIKNPLAGLIRCKVCGASMVMRPYKNKDDMIMCYANCGNKSSKLKYIESRILDGLTEWLNQYKAQWEEYKLKDDKKDNSVSIFQLKLNSLEKELMELNKQNEKLHDLLEREIYDVDTFVERSQNISERITDVKKNIKLCKNEIIKEQKQARVNKNIIPRIEHGLKVYNKTEDPAKKNALLKDILEKSVYFKDKTQRNDQFELTLFPKLPK